MRSSRQLISYSFWGLGFLATLVLTISSVLASQLSTQLYAFATFSERANTALRSTFEVMTFGLYQGGSLRQEEIQGLLERVTLSSTISSVAAWVFLALSLFYLIHLVTKFRRGEAIAKALIRFSALLLLPGLFAPMLTVTFYQDLPVLGSFVFDYRSQGILASIASLFTQGSWFVALVLLIFSVVTPILKVLALAFISSTSDKRFSLVERIAKWSMLDVFVVAILLTVFVLSSGSFVSAVPGLGLYFFAAYCILSILSTQVVKHELWLAKVKRTSPQAPRPFKVKG